MQVLIWWCGKPCCATGCWRRFKQPHQSPAFSTRRRGTRCWNFFSASTTHSWPHRKNRVSCLVFNAMSDWQFINIRPHLTQSIVFASDGIGDQLGGRVLSVLFETWLLACCKCFPSPPLWKTFRDMCANWRHHEVLVIQWYRVNIALLSKMLKIMYGPNYPELHASKWSLGIEQPLRPALTFQLLLFLSLMKRKCILYDEFNRCDCL